MMPVGHPIHAMDQAGAGRDRRGCGRLRIEEVTCDFGKVVEMSASGLRVEAPRKMPVKVGETIGLTLHHLSNDVPVEVTIIRCEKAARHRWLYGLAYAPTLDDASKAAVGQLARLACFRRVLD